MVVFMVTMMVVDGGDVDGKGLVMVTWNDIDDGGVGGNGDSPDGVGNGLAMVRGNGIDGEGISDNGDCNDSIGSDMIVWWRYW